MALQYLEFDLSDDSDGLRSWDALASPPAHHAGPLLAEVQDLLTQLEQALGPGGPLSEGHRWDLDLQIHDEQGRHLELQTPAAPLTRITLALCLTGDDALAAELLGRMPS